MPDQWDDISRPDHPGFESEKRADPRHPLEFFRGKDFHGRYVFSLQGRVDRTSVPRPPALSDIEVSVTEPTPGRCRLSLTLAESDQKDIFRALCANLMDATSGLQRGEDGRGIVIVVNRLRRWHELLRRRRDDLLSRQQVIGLMGELLFLHDRLLPRLAPIDAVGTWRGPYGDEQDFVLGNRIVEIKAQLSSADKRVRISSEDQLDTSSHEILLVHQALSPADRMDAVARTLNQLVDDLLATFDRDAPEAADLFRSGLIEAGWRNRPEYDETAWIGAGTVFLEVGEGFPRIVPSDLPAGVDRVSYALRLDACEAFVVEEEDALRMLFDGRN